MYCILMNIKRRAVRAITYQTFDAKLNFKANQFLFQRWVCKSNILIENMATFFSHDFFVKT